MRRHLNDIDARIRSVLELMRELNGLIHHENQLLKQQGSHESLRDSLKQKQSLLQSYEQQVAMFKDNAELSNADRGLWRHLIEETDSFNKLIDENKVRLHAKIEGTKRIFAIIQDAALEYKVPPPRTVRLARPRIYPNSHSDRRSPSDLIRNFSITGEAN